MNITSCIRRSFSVKNLFMVEYFKITRAAYTDSLKYIPVEHITDYHLDSYVVELFDKDGHRIGNIWLGEIDKGFSCVGQKYHKCAFNMVDILVKIK